MKGMAIFFLVAAMGLVVLGIVTIMFFATGIIPGNALNAHMEEVLIPYLMMPFGVWVLCVMLSGGGILTHGKQRWLVYSPIYGPILALIYKTITM